MALLFQATIEGVHLCAQIGKKTVVWLDAAVERHIMRIMWQTQKAIAAG